MKIYWPVSYVFCMSFQHWKMAQAHSRLFWNINWTFKFERIDLIVLIVITSWSMIWLSLFNDVIDIVCHKLMSKYFRSFRIYILNQCNRLIIAKLRYAIQVADLVCDWPGLRPGMECWLMTKVNLLMPTQLTWVATFSGTESKYWPNCGNALRVGSKGSMAHSIFG